MNSENEEGSIAALSANLSHKELEKEDVRIEGRIDRLELILKGLDRVEEQVKFTNGKVRAHEKWIAGIVGGAAIVMFVAVFLRDTMIGLVAQAVVKQIAENSIK